jgi:ferredoxin
MTAHAILSLEGLRALIATLAARGYEVLGPVVRDGAIIYDTISGIEDLPAGWTDRHEAGRYRLERRNDAALFGYNVGPTSWRRFLQKPTELMWRARRDGDAFTVTAEPPTEKYAFLGVRSCELHAIAIQDKVFVDGPYVDSFYQHRRRNAFIVAVNCGQAGGTCFCVSMRTGPKAAAGFDLALTELLDERGHRFLIETGSATGEELLASLPRTEATEADVAAAEAAVARAAASMGRELNTNGLKDLLQANPTHPHWDAVADRCLACANCTLVCPTCFCTTVEDHSDLSGQTAERVRRWDSCFTADFSYVHGGPVRPQTKSRYRQWMTHKLANWIDQFGTSGCVGCGRCVTWCPVGIDITAEAAAIRANVEGNDHGRA